MLLLPVFSISKTHQSHQMRCRKTNYLSLPEIIYLIYKYDILKYLNYGLLSNSGTAVLSAWNLSLLYFSCASTGHSQDGTG